MDDYGNPAAAAARERAAFESRQRAARPWLRLDREKDGSYASEPTEEMWQGWLDRAELDRSFPIRGVGSIPWRCIEPVEAFAAKAFGANLDELAARGGLDPFEALDALELEAPGSSRERLGADERRARESLRETCARLDGPTAPQGFALVPIEPTDALLMSMALRLDHGLGQPGFYDAMAESLDLMSPEQLAAVPQHQIDAMRISHKRRLEVALSDMRKVHEEVVGEGFHNPLDESFHRSLLVAGLSERAKTGP